MPETGISVGTAQIGTVSIDPLQLDADGGLDFPFLRVPVKVALAPVESRQRVPINEASYKERNYPVIQVSGRVLIQAESRLIGRFSAGPMLLGTDSGTQAFNIEVELDPYRVRRIEEQRHGNLSFQVDMYWLVARHPEVPRGQRNASIDGLELAWTTLQPIQVPQSHWVTLLPKLGYGMVQIVEVPIPEKIVPNVLPRSLAELSEARGHMNQGNYDSVVGHCR